VHLCSHKEGEVFHFWALPKNERLFLQLVQAQRAPTKELQNKLCVEKFKPIMMKRLIYAFTILLLFVVKIKAQQYPLFTNYVLNSYAFNPAVIGTTKNIEMRGLTRTQWVNVEGRPQTNVVSIFGKVGKSPIAAGMYFFNDQAGRMHRTGLNALVAYNQKVGEKSSLSLGFSAGYHKINLIEKVFTQDEPDPVVDGAQIGLMIPDLSMGIYFKQENGFFGGFSIPQLYHKKLFFDPSVQRLNTTQVVRQFHALGGFTIPITDFMTLEPSVLAKFSPSVTPQFDASIRTIFNKMFWIGGSFRTEDAITGMAGFDFKNWTLAYSYDFTTSALNNKSAGSHEIMLAVKLGKDKCKDEDGDGICDTDDKCPKEPGTKENSGCPEKKKDDKKCEDKDNDGICDVDDQCPDYPGPKSNKGCPLNDRDGDGIRDDIDKCPDIPGTLQNLGCPLNDRDHDGILDEVDPCPDVAGTVANMGCPPDTDRDHDGTPDKDDPCPDLAGPKSNKGCPTGGDRDGDGVPDDRDGCPNTAGSIENNGCPKVSQEERDILLLAIKNLYFDTDKFIIRPASFKDLNNVAKVLRQKKDWKLRIEGHADTRGKPEHNQMLSEKRAEAVKNYLISRGVSPKLIFAEFYGASRPAMTEKTESALQMNRRVEIEFVFD
jgi:type IX secretion system PorP/SprF family membrane protein